MKGTRMSMQNKTSIHLNTPEAYDLWSKNYDSFDNPMLAMVDHAFTLDPLRLNLKKAVELGCGTGRNVKRLHEAGILSYMGFDQSEGMLDKARQKFGDANFLSADIEKRLPLVDAGTDFVLVTLVFEHLQNLAPTLKEVFRVLSVGGTIRIMEIHSDLSLRGTKAHFQHEDQEIAFPCYTHTEEDWIRSLTEAGFTKLSIKSLSPDTDVVRHCAKLLKHIGRAVLFDITAIKE